MRHQISRIIAVVGAGSAMVAGTVLAAPAASAAIGESGCAVIGASRPVSDGIFGTYSYVAGEAITATNTAGVGGTFTVELSSGATQFFGSVAAGASATYVVPGTQDLNLVMGGGARTWTLSCGGGSGGSSEPASPSAGQTGRNAPPAWLQAYGRKDKTEKCAEGWGPSYAAWMNDNRGGWTCDRIVLASG